MVVIEAVVVTAEQAALKSIHLKFLSFERYFLNKLFYNKIFFSPTMSMHSASVGLKKAFGLVQAKNIPQTALRPK